MATITDSHGEVGLSVDDRVMLGEEALVGTVTQVEVNRGVIWVRLDGEAVARKIECRALGYVAEGVVSLGDGINQAMRAATGQPS